MTGYEEKRVRALLQEHKAVFVRHNKHEVWNLSDGANLILPTTPSDYRAWKNVLSLLYAKLGLHDARRGEPGERRERKIRTAQPIEETQLNAPRLPSLAQELHRATAKPKIKHPVHGGKSPQKEITVDLSGLLTKFGGSK